MLIKAFLIALLFSFFIYSEAFGVSFKLINTAFGLIALFFIIKSKTYELFWIGFFIAILWFYWIGLSFRYYDLYWMIPFVIIFIGVVYGLLFWIMGKISSFFSNFMQPFIKVLFLLNFSYIKPFGFNWFIPELIFLDSYIKTDKFSFFIVLISIFILSLTHSIKKRFFLLLFFIAILFFIKQENIKEPNLAPIKIYLSQTSLPQDIKWDPKFEAKIVDENFKIIKNSIKNGYDLVVLPETAFPLYLNMRENILKELINFSQKISIVTGALYFKDGSSFNSTYIFTNKEFIVANKVILVPFGEEVPLPKPLAKIVNRLFFNDAQDYESAKEPTDFEIEKIKFRNAICYEATHPKLYKNSPKYMIAISNNGWFTPSIEPILQNLIIKFYARRYNVIVYHSTNIAKTEVIW